MRVTSFIGGTERFPDSDRTPLLGPGAGWGIGNLRAEPRVSIPTRGAPRNRKVDAACTFLALPSLPPLPPTRPGRARAGLWRRKLPGEDSWGGAGGRVCARNAIHFPAGTGRPSRL